MSKWRYWAAVILLSALGCLARDCAYAADSASQILLRAPTTMEAAWTVTFVLGAVLHWFQKYTHDPANNNFRQYWFGGSPNDKSDSVCTALLLLGGIFTGLATGFAEGSNPYAVLASALTAGIAIDAMFNRGDSPAQPAAPHL